MKTTCYILTVDAFQKQTVETSEKEVALAILHVEQKLRNSEKTAVEIRKLKKNFPESFGRVKKMVVRFSSASLFFYLKINLLNTRLKDYLTSDNFGLRKQPNRR